MAYIKLHALCIILFELYATCTISSGISTYNYTVPGDINLGGLMPLRNYNEDSKGCETIKSTNALKNVEAMVFAIKQINTNPYLLPNITLGFEIYDTCSYDAITLREALNFIPESDSLQDRCEGTLVTRDTPSVVGVVGPQRSSSSVQAALLLGLYHIPIISYLSTSDELSDDTRYSYFLRTVGADSFQVKVIIDIIIHYDWKYVSFLSSDDTYGRNGQKAFTNLASESGVCIGLQETISQLHDAKHYEQIIQQLMVIQQEYSATVVVLFLHLEQVQMLFKAATKMKAQRRFIWIGSDSLGNYGDEAVAGYEEAALGTFTVVPAADYLPEFHEYFYSLTPDTSDNPWLPDYLQRSTNCTFDKNKLDSTLDCNKPGLIKGLAPNNSDNEALVVDAVVAFAHALDKMRTTLCPEQSVGICDAMRYIDGTALLDYLLNTSFISFTGKQMRFRPNGDSPGRYDIKYFQKGSNHQSYIFKKVGKWTEDSTSATIMYDDIPWYLSKKGESSNDIPKSICSEPCGIGERINVDIQNPCCWSCSLCYRHEIVAKNSTECQSCINDDIGKFYWPNKNFTDCVPLDVDVNVWSYAVVSTNAIGLVFTVLVVCFYTYNHENALIKASSRELSYIMFIGIFLAYLTALLHGINPVLAVCVLRRLGQAVATSLIYVSLAVKMIRIFRIFRSSVKSAKRPRFIRPKSQVAFALLGTLLPVVWAVIWLIASPSSVIYDMPIENEPQLQKGCSKYFYASTGIQVWNLSVLLLCSILAFLTRKLPENFNESKFILFCAFCSFLVFLAFSTTNLTVAELYYQDGYTALALFVNATIILIGLFCVKIYAIYFVKLEAWNIKKSSSNSSHEEAANVKNISGVPLNNIRTESGKENVSVNGKTSPMMEKQANAL